jgi:hypothetical protein
MFILSYYIDAQILSGIILMVILAIFFGVLELSEKLARRKPPKEGKK